jgi:hypothetical protein
MKNTTKVVISESRGEGPNMSYHLVFGLLGEGYCTSSKARQNVRLALMV